MPRFVPAVAVVAVLLGGCGGGGGGGDEEESTPSTPSTAAAASPTAPADASATVPDALDFAAPAVGGGELDARAYAGTPVAFWFWAPY